MSDDQWWAFSSLSNLRKMPFSSFFHTSHAFASLGLKRLVSGCFMTYLFCIPQMACVLIYPPKEVGWLVYQKSNSKVMNGSGRSVKGKKAAIGKCCLYICFYQSKK